MNLGPRLPPAGPVVLDGRGRTWVYDSGEPPNPGLPPVLLLHGWTSTAALNWHRCLPALAERYRVVALDHRGHGRGIRSWVPFRLEDCADDAAALIEHLDLGPCTVVGYSMGGPIAQLLWRRHPKLVGELVLCATAASFSERSRSVWPLAAVRSGATAALSFIPEVIRRQGMAFATDRWGASSSAAVWAKEEWRRHDPAALIQAGLALSRFDSRPWLGAIDVPTAVVVTEQDTTVAPWRQRYLADHIPGALAFPVEAQHRACVDSARLFLPVLFSACEAVRRPTWSAAGQ